MAIVRTIQGANGGTVKIADDCYMGLTQEALERRRAEISRAILRIDRKHQAMRPESEGGAPRE